MGYQEHKLLTSQEDAVFEVVRDAGFDPIEFDWSSKFGDMYKSLVPCLIHRPTGSFFTFDFDARPNRNNHWAEYSPGDQKPTDRANAIDWPSVLGYVQEWLENVERERSSPNLWVELDKQRGLLAATAPDGRDSSNNSPFAPEEQAQIAAQLNEIKELLVQTHQADRRALESRIDYLIDASTRLGRRDWLTMFIGGIFTWTLEGLVPPEGAREVLALAAHGLSHLFGGGVPQLPM